MRKGKMTTANQQKEMLYAAARKDLLKRMSGFLDERHKERFRLVENWRNNGSKESDWETIEQFDKMTDKQEEILQEILENEHRKIR